MADQFRVLECVVDDTLEGLKRDIMSQAASTRLMTKMGGDSEDTILEVAVRIDLQAVLQCSTSTRIVLHVPREES